MANYTAVDDASANFQTKLYSGTGSALSVTFDGNSNLQPDFIWFKNRGTTNSHGLQDVVRGFNTTGIQSTNGGDADPAFSSSLGYVSAANSNGFTVQAGNCANASSNNYVSWNWKAANGTASNSNGSITSTISANTTAGFSIVSWTGNGSGATVGHGLGAVPKIIIIKDRSVSDNWNVYTASTGNNSHLHLNLQNAASGSSSYWNTTSPTSSVFSLGSTDAVNKSGSNFIAYCFSDVRGFSKVGSYVGNGNADGAYINLGFKPAWIMTKRSNNSENWYIIDNKRSPFNPPLDALMPNLNYAADTNATGRIQDFLSNGFKLRTSDTAVNGSGDTYIYLAFAENPLVTSTGVAGLAR
tara:strand:+ start:1799 stop:2863 length:1065 start_codon:yes stop_codon:yes gene_type:complete